MKMLYIAWRGSMGSLVVLGISNLNLASQAQNPFSSYSIPSFCDNLGSKINVFRRLDEKKTILMNILQLDHIE